MIAQAEVWCPQPFLECHRIGVVQYLSRRSDRPPHSAGPRAACSSMTNWDITRNSPCFSTWRSWAMKC